MNLKNKDKKLLLELFNNSKQSNRQIAKKIGIAKETVGKKIKDLIEEEYIKKFSCKINYSKLNYKEYNLFIRLKNTSETKIEFIINYLENIENSTWIGKAFGKYDLKIAIITKKNDINLIITKITQKFSNQIAIIDYLLIIDKYKASSNSFIKNLINISHQEKLPLKYKKYHLLNDYKIDNIDKKIIYNLGENPKNSIINIAKKLKLNSIQVQKKIKNLENLNIISGYSIVFNGNKFNKIWCLVLLNFSIANLENFKEYLKKQKILSSYNETLGIWNFNVTFFANNIEELYLNLNKIRNKFSQDINNFEFLIFFEIYKYPKIPKCILN